MSRSFNHHITYFLKQPWHKAAFFFWSLVLVGLSSCESDIKQVQLIIENDKYPVEKALNVEMVYTDSSFLKARIQTPLMEQYDTEKPYTEMNKGLKAVFFNHSGKAESTLTAKYGIRYILDKTIEVRNDVVLINIKGDTLNTELLTWDERQRKIYSDKFVKITTPDEIIYGDGFESNESFTKYKIFKIRGVISLKEGEKDN